MVLYYFRKRTAGCIVAGIISISSPPSLTASKIEVRALVAIAAAIAAVVVVRDAEEHKI